MKTVTCGFCGKEKTLSTRIYNKKIKSGNKNFYCDHKCYRMKAFPNGRNYTECAYCGKTFPIKPSHMRKRNFCSRRCAAKGRTKIRIIVICPICKKEQKITIYKRNRKKTNYCSDCYEKFINHFGFNPKGMDIDLIGIGEINSLYKELRKYLKEDRNGQDPNQQHGRC